MKEAEVEAIAALAKKGYSDKVVRSMKILDQEKVNYDVGGGGMWGPSG